MDTKEQTALEVLRGYFYELNGVLRDKLDKYREEGVFSSFLGSNEYYYKDFLLTLQDKPFVSEVLRYLFESLMHYHFFTYELDTSLNVGDYIKHDEFRRYEFDKELKKVVDITIFRNILRSYCCNVLKKMGIKDFSFLDDGKLCLDLVNVFVKAKKKCLDSVGTAEFLVSKILINEKGFIFSDRLVLNDNIFYTNSPEQIISMAHVAKPGVYLVANVPYGEYVNTAFYFLIVSDGGDAFLIDNTVHDLRDQIYRNKTDGTRGKDAWIGRRYEDTYLPINQVLSFFEKESDHKDIIVRDKEFPFRSIGKISDDEGPEVILFCLTFVDECISRLRDAEFFEGISQAVCLSFIHEGFEGSSDNLPVLYKSNLPTLAQMDTSFSTDLEEVDSTRAISSLVSLVREVPLAKVDLSGVNPYQLMPIEQLKNRLIFERRKKEASRIEMELHEGFKTRYPEVRSQIADFIWSRTGSPELRKAFIEKAIRNDPYPYYPAKIFGMDTPNSEPSITLLHSLDTSTGGYGSNNNLGWPVFKGGHRPSVVLNYGIDTRIFRLSSDRDDWVWCDYCKTTKKKIDLTLVFYEYEQFRLFFGLTEEDESMPKELRVYLTQSRTQYRGNPILDDVDPIALITNPWWTYKYNLDRLCNYVGRVRPDDTPAIFIRIHTCRRCLKSVGKRV